MRTILDVHAVLSGGLLGHEIAWRGFGTLIDGTLRNAFFVLFGVWFVLTFFITQIVDDENAR